MITSKCSTIGRKTLVRLRLTCLFCLICTPAFADNPNILLFVADDMGMGDIRAYDSTSTIPTPHMDRLAAEGRLLHNAHAPAAVCTPSRFGILTGTYPFRAELSDGVLRSAYDAPLLSPDRETMPEMLRKAGYRTAAFGKWHLGMKWTGRDGKSVAKPQVDASKFSTRDVDFSKPIIEGPLDYGFDFFFGLGSSINHGPYTFIENRRVTEEPTELRKEIKINGKPYREGWVAPSWKDDGQGEVISGKALDFMEEQLAESDTPFFIYYAAVAPHWPWVPAETLHGKPLAGSGGNDDKTPWRNDMVVQNDRILGAFVALLEDPNG
ncbi:MAG: sulfatase-like hydrolase/transferase, partial [Verrucomicrobiota bacterium]